jgi:hypothetical protein
VRWHPRFKQRYRTKADALMAKAAWEERGRILWPEDFARREKSPKRETPVMRFSEGAGQAEMRL